MDGFDFFQLTALVFWVLVFIGRTVYLRVTKGIMPITLGVGKVGLRAALEIAFLVGLIVWCLEVLFYALPINFHLFPSPSHSLILDHVLFRVLGALLVTLGIFLFLWALVSFGRSWRVGIDEGNPGELVTQGAFAYSRNPIFLFIDLYFLGTFLLNGTLFFLATNLLVVFGLHYQILQEEQFLAAQYGKSYKVYRSKVRRYFGRHS